MTDPIAQEALQTYTRFVATRDEIDQGNKPWSVLADYFTDDAAYIDPAWGRIEGRENIREFFEAFLPKDVDHMIAVAPALSLGN